MTIQISEKQQEMDRKMGQVERIGAERMRAVATFLFEMQKHIHRDVKFQTDCRLVSRMIDAWAAWEEESSTDKNLDVTGKQMRDPDDQMEYLGG